MHNYSPSIVASPDGHCLGLPVPAPLSPRLRLQQLGERLLGRALASRRSRGARPATAAGRPDTATHRGIALLPRVCPRLVLLAIGCSTAVDSYPVHCLVAGYDVACTSDER